MALFQSWCGVVPATWAARPSCTAGVWDKTGPPLIWCCGLTNSETEQTGHRERVCVCVATEMVPLGECGSRHHWLGLSCSQLVGTSSAVAGWPTILADGDCEAREEREQRRLTLQTDRKGGLTGRVVARVNGTTLRAAAVGPVSCLSPGYYGREWPHQIHPSWGNNCVRV